MPVTPAAPPAATPPGIAVRVRPATAGDLDVVAALRVALLREYGHHVLYGRLHPDIEARAPQLCERQLASARDAFFLAEAAGGPIGLLRCTESDASPLLLVERFAYVSSVYVRPPYRRRGVLRALLDRAETWCRERGITDIRLHNVPGGDAAAAWAALGFGVVEEVRTRRLPEA
jgi:GNAT superfamily N-acetyltransferase